MKETEVLEAIKSVSEEIVMQCKVMSKWVVSTAHAAQRKIQKDKQEILRKQELLEATISQLKEENSKLLDDRQKLALETESEQVEIERLKEEQQAIEGRLSQTKDKLKCLQQVYAQQLSATNRLRRELQQDEVLAEKNLLKAEERIKQYQARLGFSIEPLSIGSVNFVFNFSSRLYAFAIEMGDTYIIHKASVEEEKYAPLLEELNQTQDLYAFIRGMRSLFAAEDKENQDNTGTKQ
ncbi:hypothetical protein NEHOM01_0946 [Nematocida homosporus]|uniref:uncharacterized protein n=1 Tax=Nematocida homosporus TaxID=1912981 RepID=UPI00221FB29A|nr:uncharacterized protein NEHOM01_0946 [Nematocida homosporus]KAI5185620.1 hypothetical protein NEHOM01_0946 [Nematocida homosporus]